MSSKDEQPRLVIERLRKIPADAPLSAFEYEMIQKAADLIDKMRRRTAWSYIQWALTCPMKLGESPPFDFDEWADRIDKIMEGEEANESNSAASDGRSGQE